MLTVGFALGAALALAAANNNISACDTDGDATTSLYEWVTCVHIRGSNPWWAGFTLPSAGMVALGACLGLLWVADASFMVVCCRVLRTGEAIGFVGPLDEMWRTSEGPEPSPRSVALLRALRQSLTLLYLAGLTTLAATLSPPLFGVLFLPRGLLASNLLALSLLAHVPFFCALAFVLHENRRLHILVPTDASRRSKVPSYMAAFGALFCLATAAAIIFTQDRLPDEVTVPGWSGLDGHGFVLFITLLLDSCVTATACNRRLQPPPATAYSSSPSSSTRA